MLKWRLMLTTLPYVAAILAAKIFLQYVLGFGGLVDFSDVGIVLTAGVFLLGFLFLSVGTFASTLSNNQLIAAIIAFAAMVALFSIGLVEQLLSTSFLKGALAHMNLWTQMDDFAKGIVDSRHVIYQLSVGLLFLFLATKSLEVKKWR